MDDALTTLYAQDEKDDTPFGKRLCEPTPHPFLSGKSITSITCGFDHCFARTWGGTILAWGGNSYGQLGVGHHEDVQVPVKHKQLGGLSITKISCGGNHTFVLTRGGGVWCAGRNDRGQLGLAHYEHQCTFQVQPLLPSSHHVPIIRFDLI
jgi:alpha-tubulin suppressor-like RCC1 family protein